MTVSSQTYRDQQAGNGVTTAFSVPFRILDQSHVQVLLTDADGDTETLVLTTDYTVSGVGGSSHTVTFLVAPASGETVTFLRDVPLTQETDYVENDPFPADSHENGLDKLTMIAQQLKEQISRALQLLSTINPNVVSPVLPLPEALYLLGWNEDETGLQNFAPADLATVAAFAGNRVETFTGDGSEVDFVLAHNPGTTNNLWVFIDGIAQVPLTDFTWGAVDGVVTLTFAVAPANGAAIVARYAEALPSAENPSASDVGLDDMSQYLVATNVNAALIELVARKAADLPSAQNMSLALPANGSYVHITGTTTIESFGAAPRAGFRRLVVFTGILQLTHNATSMILPTGANITTAAGDVAEFVNDGSANWRCVRYLRANGHPLAGGGVSSVRGASGAVAASDLFGTGLTADELGFRNIPQNSQSAAYTTVAADSGKHLYHPSTDANARTFTIAANASVAYPIGTAITFINETSQVVTIAINSDTLVLAGTGSTGSRSLAQYGVATAIKVGSTRWIISGTGLT